jgi:hypothetical protein
MQVGWTDTETGERTRFEDALSVAKQTGEWSGFPYEILLGMYNNLVKVRPSEITITALLHCSRKNQLERGAEYYADPRTNYPAYRGTVIHSMMETDPDPSAIVEKRYSREFEGTTISGGVDWWRPYGGGLFPRNLLRDFKSVVELPKYYSAYTTHQQQINLYRWLLDLDPEKTDMEIVYISMDGVKIIPLKAGGETKGGRRIANQVWTTEQAESFFRERLPLLQRDLLPYREVPDEDLWLCQYCEVRSLCYRKAWQERASSTEGEGRIPPRERKKSW